MRNELLAYANQQGWLVVGDSFDYSKPSLEAMGFRQMREAVRQGRADKILAYTLDGLPKRSKNYERFKRQIFKRHISMYDVKGNLLIGAYVLHHHHHHHHHIDKQLLSHAGHKKS